ncbi:MAG: hypothetical protein MUO54_08975 [Anaerolineales bacterium]|nr:hypothetical protein [Anaerolineales bacterium]
MSANRKIVLVIAVLLLVCLACDLLPAPKVDVVATAVAGTQTAAAPLEPIPDTPDTPDTPEPLPEPAPFLQVVYVKDGDAWYWDEGGINLQLTTLGDVTSVVLSDDGQIAAFVRGSDFIHEEIGAVNTDGTNLRTLVSLADFTTMIAHPDALSAVPYRMAWAPGTHILAFNTRMTFEGPGLILPDELRQVDADSLALSVLLPPGQAGDFYYSPDGSKIALVKADQISVVDANGSNRIDLLSFPIMITYSEFNYYPPVVWSPGSDALGAVIPPHDPLADPPELTTVWHLPSDGSPPSTLMTLTTVPFFQTIATFSPDLNKLAYLTVLTPGPPPTVELHISNADGTGDVIYGTGDLQFEAWSTDAEHFIFSQGGHNPKIGRLGYPTLDYTGVTLMLSIRWVDETRFLYLNRLSGSWELSLGELGAPIQIIGSTTGDWIAYDFVR